MQPKRDTIFILPWYFNLKYNDKWCIHEFKRVIWIYNMANIYITKHARLKSINQNTILQLHDGKENVFKCIFKEITGPRKICIPRYSTCIYRKLLQLVMHVWSGSRRENWYVYARPENNSTFPFSTFNHIVSLKVHSFLLKRNKTCGIHAKILLMHEFFLQL